MIILSLLAISTLTHTKYLISYKLYAHVMALYASSIISYIIIHANSPFYALSSPPYYIKSYLN